MQNSFQKLISTVRSSVYDPSFYAQKRSEDVSIVAKWFAILGVIGIGLILIPITGTIFSFTRSNALDTVQAVFPDDLVVTMASGTVSINQPQPYYIKNTFSAEPTHLVIFDGDDVLKGDAADNSAFAIVKKDHMISGTKSDAKFSSFSGVEGTTTVAKTDVVAFFDKVRPYFIPALIVGGIFLLVLGTILGTIFWVVFHMVYLLFPALLVYIVGMFRTQKLLFGEAYMYGAYASIPVAIVSYLTTAFVMPLPGFGYTVLVLMIAVVNMIYAVGEVTHRQEL